MPEGPDPVVVGVLYDFPQGDGGRSFEEALRLGLDGVVSSGRLDRPIELVTHHARGLPSGTARAVEHGFAELLAAGALVVVGPSISDNGLVVRDLADRAGVPCINYTGGEHTRSAHMFHYQVGSLEEEPAVLADHLVASGRRSVAVLHDHSPVGRRYAEFFEQARVPLGLDVVAGTALSPVAVDAGDAVERARRSAPDAVVYLGLGVAGRAVAAAMDEVGWRVPVVANSALMFGYTRREWRAGWDGWVYVDTVADDNAARRALAERSRRTAAGPVGVAAYDIGRLVGEALTRCAHLTPSGVRDALERVKRLPAASGHEGTTMGFGPWDRGALKGRFLVLRSWRDGRTVELDGP